jgi:hypothetical protein
LGSGLLEVFNRGKRLSVRAEFCLEENIARRMLITLRGLCSSETFDVNVGGLYEKHAVQRGFCVPTEQLL